MNQDDLARAMREAARLAAESAVGYRIGGASGVQYNSQGAVLPTPIDVGTPGRTAAYAGISGGPDQGAEILPGQQALIIDGPTPQIIGRAPWHVTDL